MPKLLNRTARRWLTLLLVSGFLLNIQAAYACAMMPDMNQLQQACCCGSSNRMAETSDNEPIADFTVEHVVHVGKNQNEHAAAEHDIHMGCCSIEVTVGLNEPPTDSIVVVSNYTKTALDKLSHPNYTDIIVADFYALQNVGNSSVIDAPRNLSEPYLQYYRPPLFKTTERYRI